MATGKEEVVWKITHKIALSERQYGFTKYTVNLNYVDEEMKHWLPPTDSRLRPE